MHTPAIFKNIAVAASLLGGLALLPACGMVKDDTDCVGSYNKVRFVYDHNMKYTCAFASEVEAVTLLVFDANTGGFVTRYDLPVEYLEDGNAMTVELEPGDYEFLVWAGNHQQSYDLGTSLLEGGTRASTLGDFDIYMHRQTDADGSHHVREDIAGLYHGRKRVSLPWAAPSAPNEVTVNLKKDTNTFRVVLQQLGEKAEAVNIDDYDIQITDNNGWLDSDNNLKDDDTIDYHPWYTVTGTVDVNTNPRNAPGVSDADIPAAVRSARTRASALGAAMAELTTNRIVADNDMPPVLTVSNRKTGAKVLQIPVADYVLLTKGFYHKDISDQEYLDRQDEYNMTFFLDGDRWLDAVVIINDWRIVNKNADLQ